MRKTTTAPLGPNFAQENRAKLAASIIEEEQLQIQQRCEAEGQAPKAKDAPDPEMNPVGYLLHHNWDHEGNPKSRATLWFDPTLPRMGKTITVLKTPEIKDKQTRKVLVPAVYQQEYTPPPFGLTREDAVWTQMQRDKAGSQELKPNP